MNSSGDAIRDAGLRSFGEMSGSLSHEIKNVLAIINEDAGLLGDYGVLAEKGRSLDPGRIKALAGKITEQVRRADRLLKDLNRLAHGLDEPVGPIDLGDSLAFVVSLAGRLASMRGVRLGLESPAGPVTVAANPFILQNLLWSCLNFAIEAAGEGKSIGLTAERRDPGALIRFTRLEGLAEAPAKAFPSEKERGLVRAARAEVEIRRGSGELILTLAGDLKP